MDPSTAATTSEVRTVLATSFPTVELIDDEVLDALIERRDPGSPDVGGGAKLDVHQVAEFVRQWAPIAGTLVSIAKTMWDLHAATKRKPGVEEVLLAYEAANGPIAPESRSAMVAIAATALAQH